MPKSSSSCLVSYFNSSKKPEGPLLILEATDVCCLVFDVNETSDYYQDAFSSSGWGSLYSSCALS